MTQTKINNFIDTLQVAKDFVKNNINNGVICPCCKFKIKRPYIITLTKNNIYLLLKLYKLGKDKEYIKTKEIYPLFLYGSATAAITQLKYLGGLISFINLVDLDKKSKRSGKWVLTKKAIDFLYKKEKLPSYVIVYNQKVIEKGKEIFINNQNIKWKTEEDIWQDLEKFWGQKID